MQRDGGLKILDFGLARLHASTLTAMGQIVGTPDFMSPEQAGGEKVDARSDIFSAAAVSYLILTGRPPFTGPDLRRTLDALLREDPAPMTDAEAPASVARGAEQGTRQGSGSPLPKLGRDAARVGGRAPMIVRKLLVSDGRTERELLLVGTIVVGRDPSCQLNDLDPLLSRRHAEFVPTSKGVTVRDLKSRNGILVNGDKVPEHALKPGDVVQLGHLHVRYVEERVVKSPEDHTRVRAKTETGIEVPTMAPVRPSAPVVAAAAAAAATTTAPAITGHGRGRRHGPRSDDCACRAQRRSGCARPAACSEVRRRDLDATVAPVARAAAKPVVDDSLELPPMPALDSRAPIAADEFDRDATMAPAHRPPSSPPRPWLPPRSTTTMRTRHAYRGPRALRSRTIRMQPSPRRARRPKKRARRLPRKRMRRHRPREQRR